MFLTENFKNFIKSSVSDTIQQAYKNASFGTMTGTLSQVLSRVKSKLSLSNGFSSLAEMMLDDEDPEYMVDDLSTTEAINAAVHETEFYDEIQDGLTELAGLTNGCGLSDGLTPGTGEHKSLSLFGPDGKEYDFVIFDTPVQVGDLTVKIASCENPSEIGDCILFTDAEDKKYFNPIIRGANFINGRYYPSSDQSKISFYSQLIGIENDPSYSEQIQVWRIAKHFDLTVPVPMPSEIDLINLILVDHYNHYSVDAISEGLDAMLTCEYDAQGAALLSSGSITTVSSLASMFAEQASVDELFCNVGDSLVHGHFDFSVIQGISETFGDMRATYSSAVNRLSMAYSRGGLPGLITFLVEYYRQLSDQDGDAETSTWELSDQSKLVPKNFVCSITSIITQAFSAIAQIVGVFFGGIGIAIANIVSTGISFVEKLINFVNDKGRCYFTDSVSFYPAANISIWQGYIPDQSLSSRLFQLLQANPSVWTIIPGAAMVLSLDTKRHRVIVDVHPLYVSVDLSDLIQSTQAFEAIGYCDIYLKKTTASTILEWYSQAIAQQSVTFDPNASEVEGQDSSVKSTYLSAASDAAMYEAIRKNITVFFCFMIALINANLPFAGWCVQDNSHTSEDYSLTRGIFCGLYDQSLAHAAVINMSFGWGTSWENLISMTASFCAFSRSLWDPDLPSQSASYFVDRWEGSYPPNRGSATVDMSDLLSAMVSTTTCKTLADFSQIDNDAQWALIVPKWNASSFWKAFIGTTIVTAIIIASTVTASVLISKKVTAARARHQAKVERAWEMCKNNPDSEAAYSYYRKTVRSNNLYASVFGGTKYSKNNYWESTSDSAPVSTDVSESGFDVTRLYNADNAVGTAISPNTLGEVVRLIRGDL